MAYKIGSCSQCGKICMVQDTNGKFNSFKPWLRQVDLSFSNGVRIRVILCDSCTATPDYQKINDELIATDSEAGQAAIDAVKKYGVPVSLTIANVQQGVKFDSVS